MFYMLIGLGWLSALIFPSLSGANVSTNWEPNTLIIIDESTEALEFHYPELMETHLSTRYEEDSWIITLSKIMEEQLSNDSPLEALVTELRLQNAVGFRSTTLKNIIHGNEEFTEEGFSEGEPFLFILKSESQRDPQGPSGKAESAISVPGKEGEVVAVGEGRTITHVPATIEGDGALVGTEGGDLNFDDMFGDTDQVETITLKDVNDINEETMQALFDEYSLSEWGREIARRDILDGLDRTIKDGESGEISVRLVQTARAGGIFRDKKTRYEMQVIFIPNDNPEEGPNLLIKVQTPGKKKWTKIVEAPTIPELKKEIKKRNLDTYNEASGATAGILGGAGLVAGYIIALMGGFPDFSTGLLGTVMLSGAGPFAVLGGIMTPRWLHHKKVYASHLRHMMNTEASHLKREISHRQFLIFLRSLSGDLYNKQEKWRNKVAPQ